MLSHYFQPDNPQDVGDMALVEWAQILAPHSQPAIDHACRSYVKDQPRRRPTPGDILSRAENFDNARERHRLIGDGRDLSEVQAKVIEWAVTTGRLGPSEARRAVFSINELDAPEWIPEDEAQRCVFAVRNHPAYQKPNEAGLAKYKNLRKEMA